MGRHSAHRRQARPLLAWGSVGSAPPLRAVRGPGDAAPPALARSTRVLAACTLDIPVTLPLNTRLIFDCTSYCITGASNHSERRPPSQTPRARTKKRGDTSAGRQDCIHSTVSAGGQCSSGCVTMGAHVWAGCVCQEPEEQQAGATNGARDACSEARRMLAREGRRRRKAARRLLCMPPNRAMIVRVAGCNGPYWRGAHAAERVLRAPLSLSATQGPVCARVCAQTARTPTQGGAPHPPAPLLTEGRRGAPKAPPPRPDPRPERKGVARAAPGPPPHRQPC